mmetsp:Transcript_3344/g.4694  ORF Transcript_3344/g.4694 Transcript_3344/m.4694 type:complete len:113 (+) Transcript_3344:58-396(+)
MNITCCESNNDSQEKQTNQEGIKVEDFDARGVVARAMSNISDTVNENLTLFRYGTFLSVTCLSAYGLSKTPLFFRYKNVSEIPSSYFSTRRKLNGRIVHIVEDLNPREYGTS